MAVLQNKIDFVALISVNRANPNGDPLNGNRPRTDYDGYGEISDVCIKRKIRNRMQDLGNEIFVQSDDRETDNYKSLSDRAKALKFANGDELVQKACEKYMDVRSFGQVFAFNSIKGVSKGVRGPISIHQAVSISPVDIISMQITKSVSNENTETRSSDTMGEKHFVKFGLYKLKGSINVQLAEKTGFTEEDAETVKECLKTLFVNDASAARPDGSIELVKLYWWKHNCKDGQYSSAKVHRSVEVSLKEDIIQPRSVDDYEISVTPLENLYLEEIEGM